MTLKSDIPRIANALDETVAEALDAGARLVVEEAQRRVPVDEGDLQAAIHVEKVATGGRYSARSVVAGDGGDVFYGHMVEGGTTKTPPRPFLVPAFEYYRAQVEKRVRDAVQRTIDKKGRD